jgi:hypothetical protein
MPEVTQLTNIVQRILLYANKKNIIIRVKSYILGNLLCISRNSSTNSFIAIYKSLKLYGTWEENWAPILTLLRKQKGP